MVATHVDKTANLERLLESFKQKLKEARNDTLASPTANQNHPHHHNSDDKDDKNNHSDGHGQNHSNRNSPQHKDKATSANKRERDENSRGEPSDHHPSATLPVQQLQQMKVLQERVDELTLSLAHNQEAVETLTAAHVNELHQQEVGDNGPPPLYPPPPSHGSWNIS